MGIRSRTVLVVDADAVERDHLREELEVAGYRVLGCSGPAPPDYRCAGTRAGYCSLVERVDAVVLDLWTAGDELGVGSSAEELLDLYLAAGRPVVALGPGGSRADPEAEERIVRLGEHPDPRAVVRAVSMLPPAAGFVIGRPTEG